jgi:hypothetical protein
MYIENACFYISTLFFRFAVIPSFTAHIRQISTHPNLSDMQPQHLGAEAVGGGNMDIGPYILCVLCIINSGKK